MKFLLDENIGREVAVFLRQLNHSVYRVREISPGIEDYEVLGLSIFRKAVLITADKDFGELIYKEKQSHCGVIFLRLVDQTSENKIRAIRFVLKKHKEIIDKFIVVIEKQNKLYSRIGRKNGSN